MYNIAIIGASGGIGSAFVNQLAEKDEVSSIYALSRSVALFPMAKVVAEFIDVINEDSIRLAAEKASQNVPLDLVVVATGILHQGDLMPEKALRDLSSGKFEQLFAINTIGPALVMKHFLPKLRKDSRAVFAALSARVGSISDNQLGGWYSYRASKAALNMLIKNAGIEMARRSKQTIVVGLHPGTVDTHLSKPFQGHVPADHLFSPDHAVAQMISVLDNLHVEDTGKCFAYDGKEVPC